MRTAVYPGSFDPITVGHIDIIDRLALHYDRLVVLVAHSLQKKDLYCFTVDERVELARKSLAQHSNVIVDKFSGLTVDYMRQNNIQVVVRGLRAVNDFEYEMSMASMNKKIAPEVETLLVFASPEYYYVSSRGIKEVAMNQGPLQGLVPQHVEVALRNKFSPVSSK